MTFEMKKSYKLLILCGCLLSLLLGALFFAYVSQNKEGDKEIRLAALVSAIAHKNLAEDKCYEADVLIEAVGVIRPSLAANIDLERGIFRLVECRREDVEEVNREAFDLILRGTEAVQDGDAKEWGYAYLAGMYAMGIGTPVSEERSQYYASKLNPPGKIPDPIMSVLNDLKAEAGK